MIFIHFNAHARVRVKRARVRNKNNNNRSKRLQWSLAYFKTMCLYPRLIKNRKYIANKKNNGNVPRYKDIRTLYVPVGCGNCIECRKQKAREWQVRLNEEIKVHEHNYFITLTFSCEELQKLQNEIGSEKLNVIAATAVRRMLERIRFQYKRLPFKHWLITELGHAGTERIHLHGILFSEIEITQEMLDKWWKYGRTDTGQYCSARSINYIVKYVTKIDEVHKDYKQIILASAGLGKAYTEKEINQNGHRYRPKDTKEYYSLPNGTRINMPIYYRNKFYTEDEREKLWIEKINKHTTYIRGIECTQLDTSKGIENYLKVLEEQQQQNIALGYGDLSKEWKSKEYNTTLKMLNSKKK